MSKDNKNTKDKKKSSTSKRGLASATKETKEKVARKGGKASQSSGKNKKQIDKQIDRIYLLLNFFDTVKFFIILFVYNCNS